MKHISIEERLARIEGQISLIMSELDIDEKAREWGDVHEDDEGKFRVLKYINKKGWIFSYRQTIKRYAPPASDTWEKRDLRLYTPHCEITEAEAKQELIDFLATEHIYGFPSNLKLYGAEYRVFTWGADLETEDSK